MLPAARCPPSAQNKLNDYHTMAALSTVGFIVGGVGLAAGITMVLLAPSSKKQSAAWIQPYIGLGSVGAIRPILIFG